MSLSEDQGRHVPVLLDEVVEWLGPAPGKLIVDATLGAGGHAIAIAQRLGESGFVIALDRDPATLQAAERRLRGLPIKIAESNFSELPEVLDQLHISEVDGVLLDLGLSSDQLEDHERGFSFDSEGPLDLRFNPNEGRPASDLINRLDARHLADLIHRFGEERFSRRIARRIIERRDQQPIRTARELAELVRGCVPRSRSMSIDPATRTFQALRIAVNDELKSLETALRRIPDRIRAGGRLAVISFHSLEDRPVKQAFRDDPRLRVLTPKPIRPSAEEVRRNPRSRSAKLRVAERVASLLSKPGRIE